MTGKIWLQTRLESSYADNWNIWINMQGNQFLYQKGINSLIKVKHESSDSVQLSAPIKFYHMKFMLHNPVSHWTWPRLRVWKNPEPKATWQSKASYCLDCVTLLVMRVTSVSWLPESMCPAVEYFSSSSSIRGLTSSSSLRFKFFTSSCLEKKKKSK